MPHKDLKMRRAQAAIDQRRYRERRGLEAIRAEDRARYAADKENILKRKRQWQAKNKHRESEYRKKARSAAYGRSVMLFDNAKQRAKKKGQPFALTLDHVLAGVAAAFCPKTGVLFDLTKSGSRTNPFAPSVDRIDSNRPYENDNVQIVAWFYNHMKHDKSETELLDFCARILEHASR